MPRDATPEKPDDSESPPGSKLPDRPHVWASAEILRGRTEAWIEHHGELYRLRLTSAGKLYLTK